MADNLSFKDSQAQSIWDAQKGNIQAAINSGNVSALTDIYMSLTNILVANRNEEDAPGDNPDKSYNAETNAADYLSTVRYFEQAKQEAADNYEKQSGQVFVAARQQDVPLDSKQVDSILKDYGKGGAESVRTATGFDSLFGASINPEQGEAGLDEARFQNFNAVLPAAFKQTPSADGKTFTYTLEGDKNGKVYTQQERDEVVARWQKSTGRFWLGGNRTIEQKNVRIDPQSGTVAWRDADGKWNNITSGNATEGGDTTGLALYTNLASGHGTLGISGDYNSPAFSTASKEGKGVDQNKVNSFRGLGSGDYQSYEQQTTEYQANGIKADGLVDVYGKDSPLGRQISAVTGAVDLSGAGLTADDKQIYIGNDSEFNGLFQKYGLKVREDGTVTNSQWLALFDSLDANEKKTLANNFAKVGISTDGFEGEHGVKNAFLSLGAELSQSYYAATKANIDPTDPSTYFNKILATNPTAGKTQEDLLNEEAAEKRAKLEEARGQLLQFAARNGVNMSTDALANQLELIGSGKKDLDQVITEYRQSVASRYPALAEQILAGTDVATLADPYQQEMAEAFEIPQSSIGLNDATLQSGLAQRGNAKQQLPVWEFREQLRNDPRFLQTDKAYNGFASMAGAIADLFGKK